MRRHLVAVLVSLAPACDPGNAQLSDLPELRLDIYAHQASDRRPASIDVYLAYDLSTFWAAHDNVCARIDDAIELRINGMRAELDERGRNDDFDCELPHFVLAPSAVAGEATVITIEDESLYVSASFEAGTFTPHLPTLRSPSDWMLAPGQQVRVGWSHPDDLSAPVGPGVRFLGNLEPPLRAEDAFDLVTTFAGDEIQFSIPSPAPLAGAGWLVFAFDNITVNATTCENASACTVRLYPGTEQPVTITPQ